MTKTNIEKTKNMDITTKTAVYLKIVVSACTLLTIISAVVLAIISYKVNNCFTPLQTKMVLAEERLDKHIESSDRCLAGLTGRDIFDVNIATIRERINEIKNTQVSINTKLENVQTSMSNKLDDLKNILLNRTE